MPRQINHPMETRDSGMFRSLRPASRLRSATPTLLGQCLVSLSFVGALLILLVADAGGLSAADRNRSSAERPKSRPELKFADPELLNVDPELNDADPELTNADPELEKAVEEPKRGSADPKNAPKPFPTFEEVERLVRQHFADRKDYRFGDLITRQDVEPVYKKLAGRGWKIAEWSQIEKQFLSDRDYLVKQLRSRRGQPFMREISHMPNGYDRVDRLRKMPYGRQRIKELIRGPDGHKLIQYMTTTQGGSNLGRSLSRTRKGKNFNRATGRIYTLDQFLACLKQSHKAEQARRQAK